ncbi:MAG: hypothetical protein GXO30_08410 [Epsilonproteobacteria bacterium]|nr:hypothetical protein [Campylobacterota bacterium]
MSIRELRNKIAHEYPQELDKKLEQKFYEITKQKGGDIDLFVIAKNATFSNKIKALKVVS